MFLGIFATAVTFWVVIGVIVVANGYFIYQARLARYRVMLTLAEKNQPVPLELFNGQRRSAPVGMMRGAIVLICLGLALGTFFWSMTAPSYFHGPIEGADWLPTLGLFPLSLGVALWLMAMVERRKPQ